MRDGVSKVSESITSWIYSFFLWGGGVDLNEGTDYYFVKCIRNHAHSLA